MRLIEQGGYKLFEVGGRPWVVADSFSEDHELDHAHLTSDGWMRARGCLVKFETGWAVSIIWGNMTYSSNRAVDVLGECPPWTEEPTHVEVMVLNHAHEAAVDMDVEETVLGWVDADELNHLLDILSDLPTNATFSYDMIRRNE